MKRLNWMLAAMIAATLALPLAALAETPTFLIDPSPVLRPEAREVTELFRHEHAVSPGVPIPDGYVDGGRGMGIQSSGRVTSSREILVVDRVKDKRLQESLKFARSPELLALKPQERALRIQKHIHYIMGHRKDRVTPLRNVDALDGKYGGKGVLIGDVGDLCNDGVCRHQSLMFKVLGDEAGLNVAITRGYLGGGGAHAWNEVHMDDGTIFVFDVLNSKHFYGIKSSGADKFLNMARRPMYAGGVLPRRSPWIAPAETTAVGKSMIKIFAPAMKQQIFYTLDGSEPTKNSLRYTQPVPLDKAATVKAVAFNSKDEPSKVVSKRLGVLEWLAPVTATDVKSGLKFGYYDAKDAKDVPDFETLKAEKTGRCDTFDISPGKGKDHFAMLFSGYIRISADGVYTFSVTADDGAKLWIGKDCVVDNGGRHGPQTRSGTVALKAGLHPLKMGYFDYVADETLSVTWKTATAPEAPVPASALVSPN
ncbi:MAG: chitobiase/beta-hexosaminidase C-terminal domain-containing protein [Planctomycetaceae bacterium]|nr:chitobiase/beta-hexosaminidase C-terminal domain-containing protein [Planctomycetaceae bacterium]